MATVEFASRDVVGSDASNNEVYVWIGAAACMPPRSTYAVVSADLSEFPDAPWRPGPASRGRAERERR